MLHRQVVMGHPDTETSNTINEYLDDGWELQEKVMTLEPQVRMEKAGEVSAYTFGPCYLFMLTKEY